MLTKFLDAHEQTNKNKSFFDNEIWKKVVKIFRLRRKNKLILLIYGIKEFQFNCVKEFSA